MTGVKVSYGAEQEIYDSLIGATMSQAVGVAKSILNAPSEATVSLNGNSNFSGLETLKDGDEISFYKASGVKG